MVLLTSEVNNAEWSAIVIGWFHPAGVLFTTTLCQNYTISELSVILFSKTIMGLVSKL